MKKGIIKGIVGLCALSIGMVNAEIIEGNSADKNVTVGEVETPIYKVDITWGDMTFDYKYNNKKKEFEWKEQQVCKLVDFDKGSYDYEIDTIYTDNLCTEEANDYEILNEKDWNLEVNSHYYYMSTKYDSEAFMFAGEIVIDDLSEKGYVIPTVSWLSSSKYDFVDGKINMRGFTEPSNWCRQYDIYDNENPYFNESYNWYFTKNNIFYTDNTCETMATSADFDGRVLYTNFDRGYIDMTNQAIPRWYATYAGRINTEVPEYSLYVTLNNNKNKEFKTPVEGETIGKITVDIENK